MKSHRLKPHRLPSAPSWPSYSGVSQYAGQSPSGRVTVFVDPSLGAPGLANARDLAADGDRIMAANDALFGTEGGESVQVIVFALGGATDGTGGADHLACDFQTGGAIEVCAAFGDSPMCSALLEAEVSECSMGGNLCGYSTGEALSRWCAMSVAPGVLDAFATAPTWAADGTPNFVDVTDPTDQDPDSTGCGMAFLSWLQSMGYTLPTIARAMVTLGDGATLAAVWGALTDKDEAQAWPTFQIAVSGLAGGVTSDDPFAGASAPVPAPAPQPPLPAPPPAPGAAVTLANAQGWAAQGLAAAWPPGAH